MLLSEQVSIRMIIYETALFLLPIPLSVVDQPTSHVRQKTTRTATGYSCVSRSVNLWNGSNLLLFQYTNIPEIRRTLSTSHLYSSAFVVDKEDVSPEGIPARFILTGAGWGHGVGLCQIGAAVMGEQGYKYDAILLHYYIGASIEKLYE